MYHCPVEWLLTATSLLVAFWPAWQSAGAAPADALHQEARGSSGPRLHLRLRELLVASEIALTILLVGGPLLWRQHGQHAGEEVLKLAVSEPAPASAPAVAAAEAPVSEAKAETDSAKTNESVQRERSELPVDQRSSYLRSRQIALKKFSPQGGDPS